MKKLFFYTFLIFMSLNTTESTAQNDEKDEKSIVQKAETTRTDGSVQIEGKTINYTAEAGYLTLKKENGEEQANIFYVAYTQKNPTSKNRPITFSFNGGPGSSSVWLHLGVLGPRRVLMTEKGESLSPPYELVDNEYSWLGETDLVFIDPVSTGFSRATDEKKANDFHGFKADIESVGDFIRRYLTENKRWASPKYIIGESYGTTRASGLSNHLINKYGLYLNGVILVSAVTNFQTLSFDKGNDLPNLLFFPSYAATAWYHKKLNAEMQALSLKEITEKAEKFAMNEYALALLKGDEISDEEEAQIIEKMVELTGVDATYIKRAKLRLNIHKFRKELVRDDEASVGRFDSRYKTLDMNPNGEYGELDASYQPTILGPFSTLVNDYLSNELNFTTHIPYEVLTGRVWPWDYKPAQNSYINTSEDLRQAMGKNQDMKVWIANGIYDLATPYFATEYTLSHMGLAPKLRKNVAMTYYEAGHMMYLQKVSLVQMYEEAKSFYSNQMFTPEPEK